MAMPAKTLHGSQSEGALSINPKLSASRREKLINLKQREDLKDALTEKFKSRFGHGSRIREPDEVSVCSQHIRSEVDRFARLADVTEANLARLERRLQQRALNQVDDVGSVAGVSAYSGASNVSRAMSVTSLAGQSILGAGKKEGFDWCKLDEYAAYLHEQDSLRQKIGVQALQKKLRIDLDFQVQEKKKKREEAFEEDRRYYKNSLVELERWKEQEQAREEEKKERIMKEKKDRDEQLAFERKLKAEEIQKKKDDEAALVDKIITEMEAEQRRFEKKKEAVKKSMKKVFEENMEDQRKRQKAKAEAMNAEAERMKEYNRILDEQEEQRAEELAARMERQGELMKKLQANAEGIKKGAGDGDAQRAAAQAEEQDRHFFEAEAVKHNRLQQMRLENQAYLLKQMEEKDYRKEEERTLQQIQAAILERDSQEYNEIERQKVIDRRIRNYEHRKDIEKQMEVKLRQSVPEMSEVEIKLNKPLLELVNKTLETRDALSASTRHFEVHEED